MEQAKRAKERNERLCKITEDLLENNKPIRNIRIIQYPYENEAGEEVSPYHIKQTLKKEMDLKYGKIKKLAKQANSTRNLYMRQQFGIKMLDLLAEGKRILNIDETWLGQTNYQRQVWQTKRHA